MEFLIMTRNNYDDLDFDGYLADMKEESERDHLWLSTAAFLLGSRFVLESLKPQGPRERPFLSKPVRVEDISENVFKDILKMDIKVEHYYYIYSEKELEVFKQLRDELRHYGRLEDFRTIENTAMKWMKQKNEMLADLGSLEAYRSGVLDILSDVDVQGFKVLIPWSATGDNPCDECNALDGELFEPDDFPAPPHFGCQCNDPMADPIWIL